MKNQGKFGPRAKAEELYSLIAHGRNALLDTLGLNTSLSKDGWHDASMLCRGRFASIKFVSGRAAVVCVFGMCVCVCVIVCVFGRAAVVCLCLEGLLTPPPVLFLRSEEHTSE